jgi:hypothetical protein
VFCVNELSEGEKGRKVAAMSFLYGVGNVFCGKKKVSGFMVVMIKMRQILKKLCEKK